MPVYQSLMPRMSLSDRIPSRAIFWVFMKSNVTKLSFELPLECSSVSLEAFHLRYHTRLAVGILVSMGHETCDWLCFVLHILHPWPIERRHRQRPLPGLHHHHHHHPKFLPSSRSESASPPTYTCRDNVFRAIRWPIMGLIRLLLLSPTSSMLFGHDFVWLADRLLVMFKFVTT